MLRPILHIFLHIIAPAVIAKRVYAQRWKFAWAVMLVTLLVDLDHLLANPIYNPGRCSIGFHPLHTYGAIAFYVMMTLIAKTRLLGLGLVVHMLLDGMDCIFMYWA